MRIVIREYNINNGMGLWFGFEIIIPPFCPLIWNGVAHSRDEAVRIANACIHEIRNYTPPPHP
jgi:hypothetical protein